jgi:outer membrane protein OmpA-like peptidoglycan-associated protein
MKLAFANISLVLLCLAVGTAYASSDESGTADAEFLKIVGSARSVALGGSYTVLDDINNCWINPAMFAYGKPITVGLNSIVYFQNVLYNSVNAAYKGGFGGLGIGFTMLDSGEIPLTTDSSDSGSSIDKRDYAITVGYARELSDILKANWLKNLYVGMNLQYYSENYGSLYSYWGALAGFGIYYVTPVEGLSAAFSVINVKLYATDTAVVAPLDIKGGARYDLSLYPFTKIRLNQSGPDLSFLIDLDKTEGMDPNVMTGVEFHFLDMFYLRGGYRFLHDTGSYSFGAGFSIFGFELSYSFSPYDELGVDNQFSLSYSIDQATVDGWGKSLLLVAHAAKPPAMDSNLVRITGSGCYSLIRKEDIAYTNSLKLASDFDIHGWVFQIFQGSNLIREIGGIQLPPEVIPFDGKDSNGNFLAPGKYEARLTVRDTNRMQGRYNAMPLLVVGEVPTTELKTDKPQFSPDGDGFEDTLTFYPTIHGNNMIDVWKITIYNDKGVQLKVISGRGVVPKEVVWDGTMDDGKVIPQFSKYTATLTASDVCRHESAASAPFQIKTDLYIQKDESGHLYIDLERVEFDTDKYTIRTNSFDILNRAAEVLNRPSVLKHNIRVEGHTDNQGGAEYNLTLSDNRAKAVMNYLINANVLSNRLSFQGYGLTRPRADNSTPEGRQKNRRVELVFDTGNTSLEQNFTHSVITTVTNGITNVFTNAVSNEK